MQMTVRVYIFFFLAALAPIWSQSQGVDVLNESSFAKALESIIAMPQSEKVIAFTKLANLCDLTLTGTALTFQNTGRKITAPKELMWGWSPGSDSVALLKRIAGNKPQLRDDLQNAIFCWGLFLDAAPQEAFTAMLSRADAGKATLADAARILAATERKPGQQLKQQVPKAVWKRMHESNNPCSKILALEKYDSTEQSPAELLSLYRECLMDSFGYLQVRALEGIYRSKDFRPEVAALLKEYLNSNPAADDGTLPAFPAIIGNPVDGAKMILAEMSKAGSSATAPPVSRETTPAPKPLPMVQPTAQKKAPTTSTTSIPSEAATSSTTWSIIVVLVVAACGLLWLLVKNRK